MYAKLPKKTKIGKISYLAPFAYSTIHYSKTDAVFLHVKIKKSEEGFLHVCTSVLEKNTTVHQYIEFSFCHPFSCKQGSQYSQAKRYRRITQDDDIFQ